MPNLISAYYIYTHSPNQFIYINIYVNSFIIIFKSSIAIHHEQKHKYCSNIWHVSLWAEPSQILNWLSRWYLYIYVCVYICNNNKWEEDMNLKGNQKDTWGWGGRCNRNDYV